jgi:hypothetical protein
MLTSIGFSVGCMPKPTPDGLRRKVRRMKLEPVLLVVAPPRPAGRALRFPHPSPERRTRASSTPIEVTPRSLSLTRQHRSAATIRMMPLDLAGSSPHAEQAALA